MKTQKEGKSVGNESLSTVAEDELATYLKKKNLKRVNDESKLVTPSNNLYVKYIKRIIDLIIAIPAFTIMLPLNAFLAVITVLDVGFPILFKQTRTGKDCKNFTMIKLRNMNNKKDLDGRLLPVSQRITKFGYYMRRTSLDELLNLWSVIKGDMSIIGPRPMPLFITDRMSERHKMRYCVRPGLECPRHIRYEDENISGWQEDFDNGVWYVENVSFATDCKLFLNW